MIKLFLGNSRGREGLDSSIGHEEEEEELLKQTIALSLEEAVENDNEEEDKNHPDAQEDGEDIELLRQAIALSLEGAEEEDD